MQNENRTKLQIKLNNKRIDWQIKLTILFK